MLVSCRVGSSDNWKQLNDNMKDIIDQLQTNEDLIEYIFETDKIIGGF